MISSKIHLREINCYKIINDYKHLNNNKKSTLQNEPVNIIDYFYVLN